MIQSKDCCKILKGKGNKGTTTVIFALLLTTILGFAAFTTDIGIIVMERSKLSAAVDSAALAGAQELVVNPENSGTMAQEYVLKNQPEARSISISIDPDNRGIEVSAVETANIYFARVLNNSFADISTLAKARIENIKSLSGARPLAVVQQTFVYGREYTLKEGAGDGTTGNYEALALGGTGGSNYSGNMLDGYEGTISVGDLIYTETGNMAGNTHSTINQLINRCDHDPPCTYDSYKVNCPKVIFVPVVDTLAVNGRKCVRVLGFATFFLGGVTGDSGQADVTGRFITYNMQGETANDIGDFGTYGIRLVR